MEAHKVLGCGFLEAIYQESLALELTERGIPYLREVEMPVSYKGQPLNTTYRADFICYDTVVVELKAISKLAAPKRLKSSTTSKPPDHPSACS